MEDNVVPERPFKVTLAGYLLYLSLAMGPIHSLLERPTFQSSAGLPQLGTLSRMLIGLPGLALFFGLYYMIGKGRNWARMIFLGLSVIGAILMIFFLYLLVFTEIPFSRLDPHELIFPDPFSLTLRSIALSILQISSAGFSIAALILFFQRDSTDWFKAMKARGLQEEGSEIKPKEIDPEGALIAAARTGT